jgi:hypothetical protein
MPRSRMASARRPLGNGALRRSLPGALIAALLGVAPASPAAAPPPGARPPAPAGAAADPDTDVARLDEDLVAEKVSFPFKSVIEGARGRAHQSTGYALRFEPIVPLRISEDWRLVTRTIVPVRVLPEAGGGGGAGGGRVSGLGDTSASVFLSPWRMWRGLRWGIGVNFLLASATRSQLGNGYWGAGPTAAAIEETEHWTVGALVRSSLSFAGDPDRPPVTLLLLQPIVELNLGRGWSLATRPEMEMQQRPTEGARWTVPVGLEAGKAFTLGGQALRISTAGYGNPVHRPDGPLYTVQLTVSFIFRRPPE